MFTAKVSTPGLGEGDHIVRITEVELVKSGSKLSDEEYLAENGHKDRTEQLRIVCKNDKGQQQIWLNLQGFAKMEDVPAEKQNDFFPTGEEGYATNKQTLIRAKSKAKTESALSIIGALGGNSGLPVDSQFSHTDLIGRTVGIRLQKNSLGNIRLKTSMPAAATTVEKPVVAGAVPEEAAF